jgi:hypothetical protein
MPVSEGANYAPAEMPKPVVEAGEFVFAAMHLDHGHINGMCQGLVGAGGVIKWVYDPQPERAAEFAARSRSSRIPRFTWSPRPPSLWIARRWVSG